MAYLFEVTFCMLAQIFKHECKTYSLGLPLFIYILLLFSSQNSDMKRDKIATLNNTLKPIRLSWSYFRLKSYLRNDGMYIFAWRVE